MIEDRQHILENMLFARVLHRLALVAQVRAYASNELHRELQCADMRAVTQVGIDKK